MIHTNATVTEVSEPINGFPRPRGRNIAFSFIISLRCPEIADQAVPGQFVMVSCGDDESVLPRPFSINRASNGQLSLYVAVLEEGKGTEWLSQRKPGEAVKIIGPLGNGFSLNETDSSLLLVGGGMGIAPLVFLAERAAETGKQVTVLYGKADRHGYPLGDILPGIDCYIATEDGSEGYRGFVTDLIRDHIEKTDHVYVCGPAGMYEHLEKNRATIVQDKPVSVSLETRMACGRGICYGCTIKTTSGLKKVCEDGPVFSLDALYFS